ncbi:hypothetical protein H2199_002558 [Coniosporium tulheliwenetii]|uniref:Uncharacterized protein n=1 Tax=Coniosporium tulheliwenetii TaxID=3383036 RepID=A0ACC2ZHE6_9PEZI|nr:hypothetical protein H2199_002558 [Cladosporium sp. JES 115]
MFFGGFTHLSHEPTAPPLQPNSDDRHDSSASTSPQLANSVVQSKAPHDGDPVCVLPSPTPSEDPSGVGYEPTILADLRAIERCAGSSPQASEGVSEQSALAAPDVAVGDAVNLVDSSKEGRADTATTLPAQSLKRPADPSSPSSDKRPRVQSQEINQNGDPPRSGPHLHSTHLSKTSNPQVHRHVEASPREGSTTVVSMPNYDHDNLGQRAPQAEGPIQQRRLSGQVGFGTTNQLGPSGQARTPAVPHSHLSQSGASSSSSAANCSSISCLRSIQAYLTSIGGLQALNPIEQSRMQLLEEAANIQDRSYLTLHQLMCVSSINVVLLPSELLSMPRQHLTTAMKLIEQVLCPNYNLGRNTLQWFASFPVSISKPVWSDMYQSEIRKFMAFVNRAGQRWQSFQDYYQQAFYPPLAHEIAEQLAIDSPVLQKVVFLAVLRQIWGNESSPWVSLAEDAFREDQQRYQLRKSHGNATSWAEHSQVRRRYLELLARHKETVRAAYAVPPMGTPNLQGAMQPPASRIPANINVAHVRSQSMESPPSTHIRSQTGQMQGSGQILQNLRTASVAVPMLPSQQFTYPVQPIIQQHQQGSIQQSVQPARLIQPVPSSPQTRQLVPSHRHAAQAAVSWQPFVSRPLLPTTGEPRPQPTHPDSAVSALHQAHLRSPILRPKQGDWEANNPLYQYVKSFAMPPRPVVPSQPIQSWSFTVATEDFSLIPRDVLSRDGSPPSRIIGEDSVTYRLRCSKISDQVQGESTWVISDNTMPSYFYPQINGKPLQIRRKLQHGKDLPIDVTPYIRAGHNLLAVFVNRTADEPSPTAYAFAVEAIGLKSHDNIKQDCLTSRLIPSEQSLASIKASLCDTPDDDGDIVVVSSTLSINLFDPFSASKIFDIPVRGQSCLHRDCFDLETFLETRKRSQPGWPSAVDEWRCPLCKADVRPQSLVVDGFLVDVRAKLADQGLLNTRSIIVEADGSWRPKPEKAARGSVGPESRDGTPAAEGPAISGPQVPTKEIGVISLDD